MALPTFEGTPLFGRFPSFYVVNGTLLHQLGGARKILNVGDEISYKRHGTIKAVGILDKGAILQVTLPSGESSRVAVWFQSRTTIVNGQRHSQPLVPLVQKTRKVLGYSPEWGTALYEAPIDRPPKHPIYAFDQAPMRASAP